jgi:long-chain acyl-CoA synthetase
LASPPIELADTLPKLLLHNASHHGDAVAMREKDLGIWNEYTWAEVNDRVADLALGLSSLGLGAGEVVALIGDNRPDWVWGELATQACRGTSLGVYRDALEEEVEYLMGFSEARFAFADDEEQVDKLLRLGDRLGRLERIFYDDPRGMRKYADPRLMALSELASRGRDLAAENPGRYRSLLEATRPDDVAVLCTTSGTTAQPKLAMLEHRALIGHCLRYLEADPKDDRDEYVSALPLPWIMEQVYAVGWSLLARMKVNFVEEPSTTMHDFREIGPTFALFAPRVWEQVTAEVHSRMMDASWLKRALFDLGMKMGLRAVERGERSRLADALLFRPLRDRLGFSRLRSAATGGAALGPDTFKFLLALGVPLRQLYGQTELIGAYAIHRPRDVDFNTVGPPFDGVEVQIRDPDPEGVGEIATRHHHAMRGYFRNQEATRQTLTEGGFILTGDAGFFDERGHLVVIDRMKDLAETRRGARFSPQYIENKLKFSPYIAEAVILGEGRDYLTALICIRLSIVSKWAEKQRIAFTTYTDLSGKKEVLRLLEDAVRGVNETLAHEQRIRRFLVLYKELDADDGELTRTRKLRRGVVQERYADIIDALYSERTEISVDTVVAFQDGTRQRVVTSLKVVDLIPRGSGAES